MHTEDNNDMTSLTYIGNSKLKKLYLLNREPKLNLDYTISFLITRYSKQDHTCLCLDNIFLNIIFSIK